MERIGIKAGLVCAGLVALALGIGAGCGGSTSPTSPTQCTQDSDCSSGEFCDQEAGVCAGAAPDGCKTDADCGSDEKCDMASGYCLFAGCTSDTECLPGETCDAATGVCMGTPTTEPMCHQCACVDVLSVGGCANVCDSAQNGNPNTPNFCNGHSALPQCAKCLADNCGAITSPPDPTDPTTCN